MKTAVTLLFTIIAFAFPCFAADAPKSASPIQLEAPAKDTSYEAIYTYDGSEELVQVVIFNTEAYKTRKTDDSFSIALYKMSLDMNKWLREQKGKIVVTDKLQTQSYGGGDPQLIITIFYIELKK